MHRITTILSDIGGVILLFDNQRTIDRISRLMRFAPYDAAAIPKKVETILFDMKAGLWNPFERGMIDGDLIPLVIASALWISPHRQELEYVEKAWQDIFTVNTPIFEMWRGLRARGYTVTSVSNVDVLRYRACIRLGVEELFDHDMLSFQEGIIKHDGPEFFIRALDRSGCSAEEAFYVDDRQECLDVAASIGIRGFLYDHREHSALGRELLRLGVLSSPP